MVHTKLATALWGLFYVFCLYLRKIFRLWLKENKRRINEPVLTTSD
jgi:hypothetical protein